MKTKVTAVLSFVFLLLFNISCNDEIFVDETVESSNDLLNSVVRVKEVNSSNIDSLIYAGYDDNGRFVYDHIKKHLATTDPYELIPKERRAALKAEFDRVGLLSNTEIGQYWDEAFQEGIISQPVGEFLKSADVTMRANISNGYEGSDVDEWYLNKIEEARNLDAEDRNVAVQHLTILRYTMKAIYEGFMIPEGDPRSRLTATNASCIKYVLVCTFGYIAQYAGYGYKFSEGEGAVVGGVVGLAISLIKCGCDSSEPCRSPLFVGTPDVCYSPSNGLTFEVADYGDGAGGFEFKLYNSSNLTVANELAVHAVSGTSTTFTDAEIAGNNTVYIRVSTNCAGGLKYDQPSATQIHIPGLGFPVFTVSGNTNPYINSVEGYSLVGRNMDNTVWNIWPYGPANGSFINQFTESAAVQWNSIPGYIHLTATTGGPNCGGQITRGLYVMTRN